VFDSTLSWLPFVRQTIDIVTDTKHRWVSWVVVVVVVVMMMTVSLHGSWQW